MPAVVFTRAVAGGGCNLDYPNFSTGSECGCQFQAQNCFPFTEVDSIGIDETGGCADPFAFGTAGVLQATISCNTGSGFAQILLAGNANPPACEAAIDTMFHGPYDITGIPFTLDVTYASDSNPSISFHYNIVFA